MPPIPRLTMEKTIEFFGTDTEGYVRIRECARRIFEGRKLHSADYTSSEVREEARRYIGRKIHRFPQFVQQHESRKECIDVLLGISRKIRYSDRGLEKRHKKKSGEGEGAKWQEGNDEIKTETEENVLGDEESDRMEVETKDADEEVVEKEAAQLEDGEMAAAQRKMEKEDAEKKEAERQEAEKEETRKKEEAAREEARKEAEREEAMKEAKLKEEAEKEETARKRLGKRPQGKTPGTHLGGRSREGGR
jgi:hypothetical protein